MTRKKIKALITGLTAVIVLSLSPGNSSAVINAPHDSTNGVNCSSCHLPATDPVWNYTTLNDSTDPYNRICQSCHTGAMQKLPHSSTAVGDTKYGDWRFNCVTCHDPHMQRQLNYGSYPFTGTITAVNGATKTFTISISLPPRFDAYGNNIGDATSTDDYVNWTIVPNTTYKNINYKIASNTANTVTVTGTINTSRVVAGTSTFGIIVGDFVRDQLNTPTGAKWVKFFEPEGTNSLAQNDGLGAGGTDSTPDGPCQVCHTQTIFWRSDGSNAGHNNGLHCGDCHNHSTKGFGVDCSSCHGYPPVDALTLAHSPATPTGSVTAGAHDKHVNALGISCQNCHYNSIGQGTTHKDTIITLGFYIAGGAVQGGSYTGQTTANYEANATSPATTVPTQGGPGTGTKTCSNIYCHSDVQGASGLGNPANYGSPVWDNSATVQCGSCHAADGVQGLATTMSTGSHTTHVSGYSMPCSNCHSGAGEGTTNHGNYSIDVNIDANYGGSYNGSNASPGNNAPGQGYGTCSTVYCHSSGQSLTNGNSATPTYASPIWGTSTTGACDTCHPASKAAVIAANSGSHAAHLNSAVTIGCGDCHTGAAADGSSYSSPNHVNKSIDVANSYTAGGQAGNGYGKCNAPACHGSGSPTWGTDFSAVNGCTRCHGTPSATVSADNHEIAPPGDTAGNTTGAKVGAHQAHVNSAGDPYSLAIACDECHGTLPASVATAGHINDATPGQAEVPLSGTIAQTNDRSVAGTPTYTFASGQCSNVYCHDYTRFKHGYGDNDTNPQAVRTPIWNSTMLDGTVSDCSKCHGYPPSVVGGHPDNSNCSQCHQHVAADNKSFKPANTPVTGGVELHVDGLVEGGGCDGCHGDPPTTATIGSPSGLATPSTGATGAAPDPGAHDKHVNALTGRAMTCEACHTGSDMATTQTGKTIDMGFVIDSTTYPGFAGSVATGTITVIRNNQLSNGYNWNASNPGTTVNYVSSDWSTTCSSIYCHGSTLTGSGSNQTPSWVGGPGEAQCGTCHGASAASAPTMGSHTKHASSTGGYGFDCTLCHPSVTDGSHVNGSVAWNFSTTDTRTNGAVYTPGIAGTTGAGSGGQTNALAPSSTYGSCSNLYCHSQGQSTTAPFGGGPNTTPTWGNSLPTDCTGCHNNNAAATPKIMASGAHTKHVNDGTVMANKPCNTCHALTVDGTDRAITDPSRHVNGTKNVDIISTYDSDANPSNNYSTGSCSNVYCHSDGKATPTSYYSVPWSGGPANCTFCHGGAGGTLGNNGTGTALSSSHTVHTDTAGFNFTCDNCHTTTAGSSTTIADPSRHVNKTVNVAVSVADGGTGTDGGNYTSPTCSATRCHGSKSPSWATGTTKGDCSACHGMAANPADGRDTNGDTAATDAQVGAHVAHLTAADNYSSPIACGECHKTTVDNMAAQGTYVLKVNAAGHIDSSLPAELTWGTLATTGSLAPIYAGGGGACSNTYCHGNAMPYGSTGGANKAPSWTQTTYLTGTPSLTGDCAQCHEAPPTGLSPHTSSMTIADCAGCHPDFNADGTLKTPSMHVNGIVDVNSNCDSCHGYPPHIGDGKAYRSADQEGKGAHQEHIDHLVSMARIALGNPTWNLDPANDVFGSGNSWTYVCGVCHNGATHNTSETIPGTGRTISIQTIYQFGPNAPVYNAASWIGTSSTVHPKTCSNVSCHFKDTPLWQNPTTAGQ